MLSGFISRIVILIFGTLYPAYASYKAVRTKNVKEYVKWMMYWIVFALFTCLETFTDLFLSFWFPFYYEIKIITVIYLLSPATNGSSILYRRFVHPVLTKREQEIDEYIAKAKEQGYHTMFNLGSKGVTYATALIMQTALKGSGDLFNRLKRSYSLNDLSEDQRSNNSKPNFNDQVDNSYMDDPRMVHRRQAYSPRHTISGTSYPDSYFSGDVFQRPLDLDDKNYYRYSGEVPFSGISSGYSSENSLPFDNDFRESPLVRTGSLGGTNRIRTRAASKNALPKRASLAEEGFTRSMEESQLNSQGGYVPWTRSQSLPFTVSPISHLIKPEYHHLFGQLTQEHVLTLLNQSQYDCPSSENVCLETKINNIKKTEINSDDSRENESETISEANKANEIKENRSLVPVSSTDAEKKNDTDVIDVLNVQMVLGQTLIDGEIKSNKKEIVSTESTAEPERSGKYNKRPAPEPPQEDNQFKDCSSAVDNEEDILFITPNASPILEKKLSSSVIQTEENVNCNNETKNKLEKPSKDNLEVPKKNKVKGKNVSKKLHLPKMTFSFWGQKNTKNLSESENSSTASSDNVAVELQSHDTNKNDLEVYIPLKDEKTDEDVARLINEEANVKDQQNTVDSSVKQHVVTEKAQ